MVPFFFFFFQCRISALDPGTNYIDCISGVGTRDPIKIYMGKPKCSIKHNIHPKSPFFFFFFLAPLAVGQRAYVMVRCPSCVRPCVCPSVRALTFSLNIFFSETTYRILMKFHRNVPSMVLFRIS